MKLKHIALVITLVGSILLVWGTVRGNGHQYDAYGHFTDPATGVTYTEQSTEMMQLGGFVILAVGVLMLMRVRVVKNFAARPQSNAR